MIELEHVYKLYIEHYLTLDHELWLEHNLDLKDNLCILLLEQELEL